MLKTHRTIHLRTLTDLCDKWVYIRRGIGPKVNTVGKVGELNWCSSSRGNLVDGTHKTFVSVFCSVSPYFSHVRLDGWVVGSIEINAKSTRILVET